MYVAGYTTESFTSIEARFVPIVTGEGEPAPAGGGWEVIQSNSSEKNFFGSLTVKGGWYKLEVRGIKNGQQPKEASVAHVGVGEIFLIAGQSNATGGDSNPNGPGAKYDQVNSVDFQNLVLEPEPHILPYSAVEVPCPTYVQLGASVKTAPFGNYAWCWGEFGDKIYEKLRVPVMIFNSGWSSSDIHNWQESTDSTANTTSAFGYQFPQGMPFGHIKIALNNYISQLGVRAILWHQGESDNYIEQKATTSEDWYNRYLTKLWDVISKSRDRSGKSNLAWVVARASRFDYPMGENRQTTVSANVINAQNEIINNDAAYPNVFEGPATDDFYSLEYRGDEVHFRGDGVTESPDGHVYSGLLHLAKFWADKITETDFLTESVPYAASPPPHVTVGPSAGTGVARLSVPDTNPIPEFNWFMPQNGCYNYDVNHSNELTPTSAGIYQLKVVDAYRNVVFSPAINVSGNTALPVTWRYFSGQVNMANRALLKWGTTTETNASHFEIERSYDALSFERKATVLASNHAGSLQEYSFLDEAVPGGTYYYRLKQVDFDGLFGYSKIISIKTERANLVKVYPNPVADKLTIESEASINLVEITNVQGVKMLSLKSPEKRITLPLQTFPGGLYTVTVNGVAYKILK